jgi:hypothetical protein
MLKASNQGYLCDRTRQNAVLELFSQKDANRNSVPGPFLPGIFITPPPLQTNLCHYALWKLFLNS